MPRYEGRLFLLVVTDPDRGVVAQLVKDDEHFGQVKQVVFPMPLPTFQIDQADLFEADYRRLAALCEDMLEEYADVVAIVLAVDGSIDPERRCVIASSTLAHWMHQALSVRLQTRLREQGHEVRVYLCTLPEVVEAWAESEKRVGEQPDLHAGAGLLLRRWWGM